MLEFATSVINIWEKQALSQNDQERMLKAPDEKTALAVLFDTDLAPFLQTATDLEKISQADLNALKIKLSSVLQEEPLLLQLLFLKFDALHLKQILKQSKEPIVFPIANLPFAVLEDLVNNLLKSKNTHQFENQEVIFEMVSCALRSLSSKENQTSKLIEVVVDKAFLESKLKYSLKYPLLARYVKFEIDIANLKAVLKERGKVEFIYGGNFNHEDLLKIANLREGEVRQDLQRFLEAYDISLILEEFAKDHSETLLEVGLNSFLSNQVKEEERREGFGVAKVLSFFERKLNALNNIKLILFSKRAGLPISEIEPLLLPI
ncbi:MAG: V-type ATPase subunit [bacterium]|nr:V-type ATPase subunit [bacterium]